MGEQAARLDAWKFEPYAGSGTRIVDFGCGTGALLASLPAAERIGVEPNDAARAEALARGLRVVRSPDELPDESFDLVISNHSLEHALSPYLELEQLHRILRPGGLLVSYTPIDGLAHTAAASTRPEPPSPHVVSAPDAKPAGGGRLPGGALRRGDARVAADARALVAPAGAPAGRGEPRLVVPAATAPGRRGRPSRVNGGAWL